MFKELDPLLHSQLRLAVISILLSVEEAEFVYLREKTQATAGNLSVQIDKLSEDKLNDVLKSYQSYHENHHIDENKQVYMGKEEFESLQNT